MFPKHTLSYTAQVRCKPLDVRFLRKANLVEDTPAMVRKRKNKGNLYELLFPYYFREQPLLAQKE